MRALCAELGNPQRAYRTLHVVGTNGKSSVTVMAAALLAAAGRRTGACVSPHVYRWSERTKIAEPRSGGPRELGPEPFGRAVARVAAAVEAVDRGFGSDERITQFEAAIATSFVAFAEAEVDVAVIEAGLGGRLDATNVIDSTATALTSVGLDHVQWLGETLAEIATEKLAVLRPGTKLVIGALDPEIEELARRRAAGLGATVVATAGERFVEIDRERGTHEAAVPYLARDAAVALALAETVVGTLDPELVRRTLVGLSLPGRAEVLPGDPPLIADAAHNEQGARALAEALPVLAAGRPVHGCISMLADKDANAVIAVLAPALAAVVCTAAEPGAAMGRPGAVAAEPEHLARLAAEQGLEALAVSDPQRAIEICVESARTGGGVALCAGSHYLLRHAWTARKDQSFFR